MDDESKNQQEGTPSSYEIDFFGYIASLAFQAMVFLGDIPSPVTQKVEKNLSQAKLLIDTLVVLREKTKGNLNEREQQLLDSSIYELQIKYVEQMQGVKKQ
jgi:hypothetical protein